MAGLLKERNKRVEKYITNKNKLQNLRNSLDREKLAGVPDKVRYDSLLKEYLNKTEEVKILNDEMQKYYEENFKIYELKQKCMKSIYICLEGKVSPEITELLKLQEEIEFNSEKEEKPLKRYNNIFSALAKKYGISI